jgi:hypothetical protein
VKRRESGGGAKPISENKLKMEPYPGGTKPYLGGAGGDADTAAGKRTGCGKEGGGGVKQEGGREGGGEGGV